MSEETSDVWTVRRIDDTGNTFVVRDGLPLTVAERLITEFKTQGYKQMFWTEREARPASVASPQS